VQQLDRRQSRAICCVIWEHDGGGTSGTRANLPCHLGALGIAVGLMTANVVVSMIRSPLLLEALVGRTK
jgi:hypothetical protein